MQNTYENNEFAVRHKHLLSFHMTRTALKSTLISVRRCLRKVINQPLPSNDKEIHRQTHRFSFDMTRVTENGASSISSFIPCIRCNGNVSNDRLPSNGRRIHIQIYSLKRGIYEVRRSNGLQCQYILTKVLKDWFRHSKADKGDEQTQTVDGDCINLHVYFQNTKKLKKMLIVKIKGKMALGRLTLLYENSKECQRKVMLLATTRIRLLCILISEQAQQS